MKLLEGKRILVSGVANKKSLAWGIALALHAHGAELAFTCLESNVRRLKKFIGEVDTDRIFPCDVTDDTSVAEMFKALSDHWGGELDGFVHAIAYAKFEDLEGEFIKTERDGFILAHEVSSYSLVAMTRCARPLLKAKGGSIICLTFGEPHRVFPNYNVMGPAKSSLETSALYLAYDLGKDGIRVNVLAPGPIKTSSAQAIKGFEFAIRELEKNNVIRRNVTQEDVGGPAVFFMSDLAKGVTGTILHVDGGANIMSMTVPE